ncbi:MAG: hypothetical protein LBJ94_03770 [Puniceicoccales bacterium]|jgi:hypothetical protein|nr:hypothetical protein [Puniceicoccales bacterium]
MMNVKKERVIMVDMEQNLIDDKSGQYRRGLLDKLRGYEGDMSRLIGAGVSSDKFAVYEKVRKAIKQACYVIEKFR